MIDTYGYAESHALMDGRLSFAPSPVFSLFSPWFGTTFIHSQNPEASSSS